MRKIGAWYWYFLLPASLILLLCIGIAVSYLCFPRRFSQEVLASSAVFQISPAMLYAVIRTESGFDPEAISSAGACGLMQLLPETFEEMYLQEEGAAQEANIFSPKQNVFCGARYLAWLFRKYGLWETALAAYNAGPGRVDLWLLDERYSKDGKRLSQIPFPETAGYVKKVLNSKKIYESLYADLKTCSKSLQN